MYTVTIILIVALLATSGGLFLSQKKLKQATSNFQSEVKLTRARHIQEIQNKDKELTAYKETISDNFNEAVPYGERFLMGIMIDLLHKTEFKDVTFFHQVEYQMDGQFQQLDFLIVAPTGIIVLESKYWNGVTYLYSNNYKDIFQNTMFENFGVGSSEKIKVFNANFSENSKNKISFSTYRNPIAQVRNYSRDIKNILSVKSVKNAVIFHTSSNSNVLYNDEVVEDIALDNYTNILVDNQFEQYLSKALQSDTVIDTEDILKSIDQKLFYRTKIDISNCKEDIFSYLLHTQ